MRARSPSCRAFALIIYTLYLLDNLSDASSAVGARWIAALSAASSYGPPSRAGSGDDGSDASRRRCGVDDGGGGEKGTRRAAPSLKSGLAGPRHVARAMATVRRVVRLQPGEARAAIYDRACTAPTRTTS